MSSSPPDELRRLEAVQLADQRHRHVLDAFLFCCYTGLRYSDFSALKTPNLVLINRKRWLCLKMMKTNIEIKLPLALLFDGKALEVIDRYQSVEELAAIPSNCETNRLLAEIGKLSGVKKHFTFHTARPKNTLPFIRPAIPVRPCLFTMGFQSRRCKRCLDTHRSRPHRYIQRCCRTRLSATSRAFVSARDCRYFSFRQRKMVHCWYISMEYTRNLPYLLCPTCR